MKFFIFLFLLITLSCVESSDDNSLADAVTNEYRSENNRKRDKFRNPIETLSFFGLDKEMKVLEIIPGRGWYTEIISKWRSMHYCVYGRM